MDNLIFCLNVTVPIFLTLLLGYFFRRIGLFDETFVNRMNKFVFVIPLPVLLFQDIAKIDIYEAWDPKMILFCFAITSLSIMISVLLRTHRCRPDHNVLYAENPGIHAQRS